MNTINIPVLALRGMTAFPGETVSFDVEREISIFALDNAMEGDRRLFLVTQRKIGVSEPEEQDLYEIGTVCHVLQIIKTSETTVRVLVEGEQRARLHRLWQASPFLQANVELLEDAKKRRPVPPAALYKCAGYIPASLPATRGMTVSPPPKSPVPPRSCPLAAYARKPPATAEYKAPPRPAPPPTKQLFYPRRCLLAKRQTPPAAANTPRPMPKPVR